MFAEVSKIVRSKIAGKMAIGYVAVTLLIVGCAGASYFGISRLSTMLDYLLGPAWETADGAMEASIEIEAQMLATHNLLDGVALEQSQVMLEESRRDAQECIERMSNAGTLTPNRVSELKQSRAAYEAALDELLEEHQSFTAS